LLPGCIARIRETATFRCCHWRADGRASRVLLHAIIGATMAAHLIVGRDHAGPAAQPRRPMDRMARRDS
jgi:hypothetical protein